MREPHLASHSKHKLFVKNGFILPHSSTANLSLVLSFFSTKPLFYVFFTGYQFSTHVALKYLIKEFLDYNIFEERKKKTFNIKPIFIYAYLPRMISKVLKS